MVHYKLTYFDLRGAAECARQIFALAGQQFEDNRLSKEEIALLKPKIPFENVPVLEVDGKQLGQSLTICRYLARQFGLAGETPFDEAVVDSIAHQSTDFRVETMPYFYTAIGMKEGDLEQLKKEVFFPACDKFFGILTKFLKQNPSGFLVGDSVTWLDLLISECSATMLSFVPEVLDGYPEASGAVAAHGAIANHFLAELLKIDSQLKTHMENVRAIPNLKKWIKDSPVRPF